MLYGFIKKLYIGSLIQHDSESMAFAAMVLLIIVDMRVICYVMLVIRSPPF